MTVRSPGFVHVAGSSLAVTIAGVLPIFLTGGLSVQIRNSVEATSAAYGAAVATFFGVSAVLSVWAGRLVQRIGPRTGQQAACFLAATSLLVVALFARSSLTLAAGLAIGGIGYSLSQVSTNFSLVQLVSERRQGVAFGIKQAGIPAATLLGGVSVPLIGLSIGWRWAFVLGCVVAVLAVMTLPPRVAHLRDGAVAPRLTPSETRPLILLGVAGGFGSAAGNALGAFFVPFASIQTGNERAGLAYAAGGLICLIARVSAGWGADRAGRGRLLMVAAMFVLGSMGYALLALEKVALIIPALLLTFGAGWGWPGLLNLAVVVRNIRAPAAATGVTQTGAFLGGVTGPLAFGFSVDHASYGVAWLGAAVSAAAAALFCIAARRSLVNAHVEAHLG